MIQSSEINELAAALALAQGEIEDASKTSTNPYFKSRYADLAAVRSVIRDPLSRNGLAWYQVCQTTDTGVSVETRLTHQSGQYIGGVLALPYEEEIVKGTNEKRLRRDAHAIGSLLTYARRYSIMGLLGLAADDDDGNAAVNPRFEAAARAATGPARRSFAPSAQEPVEAAPAPESEAPVPNGGTVSHERMDRERARPGARPTPEMVAAAFVAAEKGSQGLTDWWSSLTNNNRKLFSDADKALFKKAATQADAAADAAAKEAAATPEDLPPTEG